MDKDTISANAVPSSPDTVPTPASAPPLPEVAPFAGSTGVAPPMVGTPPSTGENLSSPVTARQSVNPWDSRIPRTNRFTLIIGVALIALVDTPIVIASPALFTFYAAMLVALAVQFVLSLVERDAARKFAGTPAHQVDTALYVIIAIRCFVVLLNLIPFIQLLGWLAAQSLWLLIPAEFVLLRMRQQTNAKSEN